MALGEALRQLYVHEQGLLPRRLNEQDVWVRSTDVPRTRESALGMLLGLYPPDSRSHGQTVRTWRKPMVIEDMIANPTKCPRYATPYPSSCHHPTGGASIRHQLHAQSARVRCRYAIRASSQVPLVPLETNPVRLVGALFSAANGGH